MLGNVRVRPTSVSNSVTNLPLIETGSQIAFTATREPPSEVGLHRTSFSFWAGIRSVNDVACNEPTIGGEEQRSGDEIWGHWTFERHFAPGDRFDLEIQLDEQIEVLHCTVTDTSFD
jgi:hypothetical protein